MPTRGRKPGTRNRNVKEKEIDSIIPKTSQRAKRSKKSETDSVCSTPKCTPQKVNQKKKG